jgi:type I restriction enzyme S subunit
LNDKEKWPELGSGQPFISKSAAEEVLIVYPPLPEQSRIATVLSWFDDLIEVKKKQNETLEKTAMAIFKNWFIDFEPFKDEEFIFNEELEREIPKGWEVRRLGELVKAFKGISYKSSEKYQEYIEEGYIFITLDNFVRGGGFKNEYSWIKSERIKPSHLVNEGDLIIALTDMTQTAQVVGSPAIVILPNGFDVGVISLDCMKLEPVVENLKYYLYMSLKDTQEDNSTFANGVNVLHLMVNNFLNGKILFLPPPHILQSFHSLVEPLFQKIILNQKQIMTIRKIRDTLLPLLVFGKLRVEEL